MPDLKQNRRELMRWYVLITLSQAGDVGVTDSLILSVISAQIPDALKPELHREMTYLEKRELIEIETHRGVWTAELTRTGFDLVEYNIDCDPGIARPKKYG